jgi:hypothetical protein
VEDAIQPAIEEALPSAIQVAVPPLLGAATTPLQNQLDSLSGLVGAIPPQLSKLIADLQTANATLAAQVSAQQATDNQVQAQVASLAAQLAAMQIGTPAPNSPPLNVLAPTISDLVPVAPANTAAPTIN